MMTDQEIRNRVMEYAQRVDQIVAATAAAGKFVADKGFIQFGSANTTTSIKIGTVEQFAYLHALARPGVADNWTFRDTDGLYSISHKDRWSITDFWVAAHSNEVLAVAIESYLAAINPTDSLEQRLYDVVLEITGCVPF